jgi:A/G-specific adenine glycosylase
MEQRANAETLNSIGLLLAELRSGRALSVSDAVLEWADSAARSYPWRNPGRSSYEVLIAEVLLRRTTASAVARMYQEFLSWFPCLEALHGASEAKLRNVLSPLGLQRLRSRGLKAMAGYLIEKESGQVPGDIHRLLKIPHVGPYTAAAVLSFAFQRPIAIVDSNVERVLRRLFNLTLPARSTGGDLRAIAAALLPRAKYREFNLGLLDLGALVCRYGRPRCGGCPLGAMCEYASLTAGQV